MSIGEFARKHKGLTALALSVPILGIGYRGLAETKIHDDLVCSYQWVIRNDLSCAYKVVEAGGSKYLVMRDGRAYRLERTPVEENDNTIKRIRRYIGDYSPLDGHEALLPAALSEINRRDDNWTAVTRLSEKEKEALGIRF